MANGNGSGLGMRNNTSHFDERFAALDERVTNLRSSFTNLEHSTARGFAALDAKLGEMSATINANQRTPWGSIWTAGGVVLTILGFVGWLVYTPVKDDQGRLEKSIGAVADGLAAALKEGPDIYIPRREGDALRARGAEDRANTLASITALQSAAVTRAEWSLRNDAVNSALADIRREIDQLRQDFGGTYSLRDAIADLKERLQRVETREPHPGS